MTPFFLPMRVLHAVNATNWCEPAMAVLKSTHSTSAGIDTLGGRGNFIKKWLSDAEATQLMHVLQTLPTQDHDFEWMGHSLEQKRLLSACGDPGIALHSHPRTPPPPCALQPLPSRHFLTLTHTHRRIGRSTEFMTWQVSITNLAVSRCRSTSGQRRSGLCNNGSSTISKCIAIFAWSMTMRMGGTALRRIATANCMRIDSQVMTLSTGATRKMQLSRDASRREVEFNFEHGDLLILWGNIQTQWKHGIRPEPSVLGRRLSATLRSTLKRPPPGSSSGSSTYTPYSDLTS